MRALVLMLLSTTTLVGCEASVRFLSTSGSPNGVLVTDGFSTGYTGYTTATDTVAIGARSGNGEAVGFSQYRPAQLRAVPWSTTRTYDLNLGDQLRIPITFWVLSTPFNTNQQRADAFWFAMQTTYWPERVGVLFTPTAVRDATGGRNVATHRTFTCGAGNANMTSMRNDIGFDAGRINVYIVDSVDGSTTRGQACQIGGPFVAIAGTAGTDLLSHEIGHNFALDHTDDLTASFDTTGVMHSASSVRSFLTEGQLFRMHMQPASAVNAVYAVRPGQITRNCARDTVSATCPPIAKRLWADGATFPAN